MATIPSPATLLNLKSDTDLEDIAMVYGLTADDVAGLDHADMVQAIAKKAGYRGAALIVDPGYQPPSDSMGAAENPAPATPPVAPHNLTIGEQAYMVDQRVVDYITALRKDGENAARTVTALEEKVAAHVKSVEALWEQRWQRIEAQIHQDFHAALRWAFKQPVIGARDVEHFIVDVWQRLGGKPHTKPVPPTP